MTDRRSHGHTDDPSQPVASAPAQPSLDDLEARLKAQTGVQRPTPELWNPPNLGDVGLAIDRHGQWHYQGSPILRPGLVKLFASVLTRTDDGGFALVTPGEKVLIAVADAPFVAVEMAVRDLSGQQDILLRTNVDEVVVAGPKHPLRFDGDPELQDYKPYVTVRHGIEARLTRALFYDLVSLAETIDTENGPMFGVSSGGAFFAMAPAGLVEG